MSDAAPQHGTRPHAAAPPAPAPGALRETAVRAPEAAPPGPAWETAWIVALLLRDLAALPFHLVLFLARRRQHRRRLLAALAEGAVVKGARPPELGDPS